MQRLSTALGAALVLGASWAAPAAAQQYELGDGLFMYSGVTAGLTGYTTLDLGSTPGVEAMPMPMSIAYGDTSIALSLQETGPGATGRLVAGDNMYAPTGGQNFLWAYNANITLAFAGAQNYFAANWGFMTANDSLSFYNGETLLGQINGAQYMALETAHMFSETETVEFQFTELGYDRVVVSASGAYGMEIDSLRVGAAVTAVNVAPAPVGGVGGLIAFLAMMGARRRGLTWKEALREANVLRRAPHGQAA